VFEAALLTVAILYAVGILLTALVAWFARYPTVTTERPFVSVIVAARNEEHNIGRCLESMTRLTWPRELLEVIIVNDRSDDDTPAIVRDYASRFPFITLLHATPGTGHLAGKTNAVTQGIDASRGSILMMTDADCGVPAGWIEETVKYYTDDSIGLVPGFTEIRHRNIFEAIQTIDWFGLFSVASATTAIGFPVTAVGTNFTVRRAAYDAVGGYRGIPFSVTEDYALFHAVTTRSPYRARFPMDPRAVVSSEPCPTWTDLYRQRKRWFTGGKGMDVKSILIFAVAWLMNAGIIAGLFFSPVAALTALGIKTLADVSLVLPAFIRFRTPSLLAAFPFYEIYFFLYVLLFPPIVLVHGNIVWKDRDFKANK
jgi:cellulose synthase/poly-beta-1,6-N-acetylglucosamine synthase-like glycosyltransferase